MNVYNPNEYEFWIFNLYLVRMLFLHPSTIRCTFSQSIQKYILFINHSLMPSIFAIIRTARAGGLRLKLYKINLSSISKFWWKMCVFQANAQNKLTSEHIEWIDFLKPQFNVHFRRVIIHSVVWLDILCSSFVCFIWFLLSRLYVYTIYNIHSQKSEFDQWSF